MATKFTVGNEDYQIKINYFSAIETLPEEFGLELTKLLVDDQETNDSMRKLLLDDNLIIKMMWYYMKDTTSMAFEDLLKTLSPSELNSFREAFWTEVTNFSGPLKAGMLKQVWTESKKYVKNQTLDSSDLESLQEE